MDRFLFIIKWAGYILVALLIVAFVSLLVYRAYLKSSTKIETSNGISSLEEIRLGNLKQWIFIRSTNRENPILLFLHGGPGEPLGGMPSSRKFDADLIRHYTVVHWDQRGAGKSYHIDIPINEMSHDRLVEDCKELIDYLRNRFGVQKVFLVAHSGGTPIGIKMAHRYPEKLHAYVGVAQIINDYEQQRLSYNFIVEEAARSGNAKAQHAIRAIGPPPFESHQKIFDKAKYIVKYGGFIRENPIKQITNLMVHYLTSPEYSLLEGIRTIRGKGLNFTINARWEELKNVDFTEEIQSIQVPIYFFAGEFDMITPTALVADFYQNLDAPKGKELIIFENSAHVPMLEEKEKYEDLLVHLVLKENQDNKN